MDYSLVNQSLHIVRTSIGKVKGKGKEIDQLKGKGKSKLAWFRLCDDLADILQGTGAGSSNDQDVGSSDDHKGKGKGKGSVSSSDDHKGKGSVDKGKGSVGTSDDHKGKGSVDNSNDHKGQGSGKSKGKDITGPGKGTRLPRTPDSDSNESFMSWLLDTGH